MTNMESEISCYHATTSVTIQVSKQNMVPSEPQTGSSRNLKVTELLPL